jgi:hypothetical protein
MRRLRHARPSPALIVAVIALVGALAGSAVAEQATTSISKKKTKKIAKNQANKQIDLRLPIGAGELGEIREVSTTNTVPAGTGQAFTTACPADEQVISGGSRLEGFAGGIFYLHQVDHRDGNGWRAGGFNATGAPQTLVVHAYCLESGV